MGVEDLAYLGVRCRPIDVWPGELSRKRDRSPFRATFTKTVEELAAELRQLSARQIVLQLALYESDIVVDGTRPKATARTEHPGVVLAFESKVGPLKIATDRFTSWEDNLRAIALGLGDLRRLDRYGITRRGEQYSGWRQLPPPPDNRDPRTVEDAARTLCTAADVEIDPFELIVSVEKFRSVYRAAAKRHHPDAGGNAEAWRIVSVAVALLEKNHGL